MAEPRKPALAIGPAPHLLSPVRTPMVMLSVIMALLPVTIYGITLFRVPALILVLVSVGSAVFWELLFQLVTRQKVRVGDLSAVVTGLLVALIVPASLPPWMIAMGTFFGIVVAKEFFGGIGANPFNPALSGRAFLLMSFPAAMTTWYKPGPFTDATTMATPLKVVRDALNEGLLNARQAIEAGQQYIAPKVVDLPGVIMPELGKNLGLLSDKEVYWSLFLGNHAGSIGETSILLILIGGAFLLLLRVIDFIIPVSMLAATALLSWLLGIDPLLALLSGGAVFAAIFMATDYSSSPMTPVGKLLYGASIGFLMVLIRRFSSFPEGATYAILLMNSIAPFLNRIRVRKYGFIKPAKAPAAKEAGK